MNECLNCLLFDVDDLKPEIPGARLESLMARVIQLVEMHPDETFWDMIAEAVRQDIQWQERQS